MQKATRILVVIGFVMVSIVARSQNLAVPNGLFNVQGLNSDARLESHLEVENSGNSDLSVKIFCDKSQLVNGHQTYYCWALCYDTVICNSPDPMTVPGRTTNTSSFHSYLYPNNTVGLSTIRYTFYDENNQSDSASASITYDVLSAGINEVQKGSLSAASPNPASSFTNINYILPSLKDGRLVIYNMLGTVVKEYRLSNAQSSMILSTSDLSSGVYVYSLINNGQSVSTKKLIVNHR